jgi:hypothetical protein
MLAEAFAIGLELTFAAATPPAFPALMPYGMALFTPWQSPIFDPSARAVSNWRLETLSSLNLAPDALAKLLRSDAPSVPRCIKLNNYWCIKRAGWNGEIAADRDGHVAFASVFEGARVAVRLLRRYYLDYHRRSALAIVSHWAPANCYGTSPAAPNLRAMIIPKHPAKGYVSAFAPMGLMTTLRARWLTAHAGRVQPAKAKLAASPKLHKSIVPDHVQKLLPAPSILVGGGETSEPPKPVSLASLTFADPILPGVPGNVSCAGEDARIENYARRAVDGLNVSFTGDLALFEPDGKAAPNLRKLMLNMAKVEIASIPVRESLIDQAIAQAGTTREQ